MVTAIATKPATQTVTKKLVRMMFVTARYTFNAGIMAGSVCYGVRSIKTVKGQEVTNNYQCFIHTDGTVSCNCESRKALCCHALFVSEIENERDSHEAEQDAKVEAEVAEVLAELDELVASQVQDEPTTTQPVICVPAIAATKTSASTSIVALKTPPQVRNVSQDWLLKGSRSGAFSGRVA